MEEVILSLGSNLGDRLANLRRVLDGLDAAGMQRERVSGVYETRPWGFIAPTSFYNIVAVYQAAIEPARVLELISSVESAMGRKRSAVAPGYESRIIDIDILFFGSRIINESELIVPHPRMAERNFVLQPLAALMPEKVHPLSGRTVAEMLRECSDESEVILLGGISI